MKKVLGVDLASGSWSSNGTAQLTVDEAAGRVVAVIAPAIRWPREELTPHALAQAVDDYMREAGASAVALDGPQGWRDPGTPAGTPGVGRRCEYLCRTQGKTGIYPRTYPGGQRPWIEFCIEVFADLLGRASVVLANTPQVIAPAHGYLVLECFPTSAWRSSGLTPLPGKAARPALAPHLGQLARTYGLPPQTRYSTSHDDLQAIVAALCALPLVGGPATAEPVGEPATVVADASGRMRRVEGLIWNVRPLGLASREPSLRA
jgi:hypothetical protein